MIIGIDCATDAKKVGLVRAELREGAWVVTQAEVGGTEDRLVSQIADWLSTGSTVLLALDAPLGWPIPLGQSLEAHRAGAGFATSPNELFRRTTDRFVRQQIGKQPLDIGADRIARTAHAALTLLNSLRSRTHRAIPLAWTPVLRDVAAIEVYPAATLRQHGLPESKYKKPSQVSQRRKIVAGLASRLTISESIGPHLQGNSDVLDAAVCVLAAVDFLDGRAMPPQDLELAKREGWIWLAEA